MSTQFKLLVIDVDGTLIGAGAFPTQQVTEAVKAAKESGLMVALGTGRASEACYHLLDHLSLDGLHIFFDGAAIVDWPSRDIISFKALPPRATDRLISLARYHNLFLEIYAHEFYFIETDNDLAAKQREKLQLNPLVTDLKSLVDRVRVIKAQLLAASPEEKVRADVITEQMAGYCKMAWSLDPSNGIYFGNAINDNVSKGDALKELVNYLGIELSETVVIGDSYNDMGIFEVAGTAIAMGHSPKKLKDIATWEVPSVKEDGVAVAIERYVLNS